MIDAADIIHKIKEYNQSLDESLIQKAYVYALDKHGTQMRDSGDPFISHPLEVADILADLKMDTDTIAAALLHDTLEDTDATYEELCDLFGKNIANIVNGVTKLSTFENSKLADKQTENFKKLLISAASDIRVLVIKLADRLHNMRTLKYKKRKIKRQFIAKETLEIYAPLAERIGILEVKDELQDLAFRELYQDIYDSIKARLNHLYESSEQIISSISLELSKLVEEAGISGAVSGRLKTPYSIWEKMNVRNISFEQLSDIMAYRIIVDTVQQCYLILGLIHRNYLVVPGRFRDYISTPKNNNYQSLHTSVIGPLNKRIEIQIRTKEMHQVAEYGIAAHWDYKSPNSSKNDKTQKELKWIGSLVNLLENTGGLEDFLKTSKTEILSDVVFCISPAGKIISLPRGATALDFAYYIHSDIGNHAESIKINGRAVPFKTPIENGDQVEVFTSQMCSPKAVWETYVRTMKAKAEIRRTINGLERERLELIGKTNFEDFFQTFDVVVSNEILQKICKKLKLESPKNLFHSLGTCELTLSEVLDAFNKVNKSSLDISNQTLAKVTKSPSKILGLPNMPILPVTCCRPVPGDKIIGLVYDDRGVEIHIEECRVFNDQEESLESRIIPLSWSDEAFKDNARYPTRLSILTHYEPGNLANIASIIEKKGASIINLKIGEKIENFVNIDVEIDVSNISQLSLIIAKLRNTKFINKVTRV